MKAIILAANKSEVKIEGGSCLPKAMVFRGNQPVLEHVLDRLPPKVKEVVLIVGHRGDLIRRHFGDNHQGRQLYYIWQFQAGSVEEELKRAVKVLRHDELLFFDGENLEGIEISEEIVARY
ncbi:hypothetical protein KJ853_03070 [Patescibacteria group bacterium]|nr:hypothetical protein [Patescibacteria group bacterium]